MKNHLIARLPGGLGNQLFVFAAALYYGKILDWPLKVDLSRIDSKHGKENIRDLLETRFDEYILEWRERDRFKSFTIRWESFWRRTGKRSFKTYFLNDQSLQINERKLMNIQSKLQWRRNGVAILLDGYFQDFTYFDYLESKLIPKLSHLIIDSDSYFPQESRECTKQNICSIHIRLGDFYSELRTSLGVLDVQYYLNAVKKLIALNSKMEFHIFSNDIKLARKLYAELNHYNVTWKNDLNSEIQIGGNAIETLREMASYENFILSNSTFSFWSAKLATRTRDVLYPSPMYLNSNSTGIGGIPKHWTSLSAQFMRNDQ